MILSYPLNMEQYSVFCIGRSRLSCQYLQSENFLFVSIKVLYISSLESLLKCDCMVGFAALIESDAEGIGGSGFVECIREHIHSVSSVIQLTLIIYLYTQNFFLWGKKAYAGYFNQGWHCQLTEEQFIAVKELVRKPYAVSYVKLFNVNDIYWRSNLVCNQANLKSTYLKHLL